MNNAQYHLIIRHRYRCLLAENRGFALVAVLVISLLLSATLVIILAFVARHRKLLLEKAEDLQTLYLAESALHRAAADFYSGERALYSRSPRTYSLLLADRDSARIVQFPWGGYTALLATAGSTPREEMLSALIAKRPSSAFRPAVIVDPAAGPLTLAGNARLTGAVRTGPEGVRAAPPGERRHRQGIPVYGNIVRRQEDGRPGIQRDLVNEIYREFRARLARADTLPWLPTISEADSLIDLAPGGMLRSYRLPPGFFHTGPRHIRGPGILVIEAALTLDKPLRLSHFVSVLCREEIRLDTAVIADQALFYSPRQIIVAGTGQFRGQLFSEEQITVTGASTLAYPSLLMVYGNRDESTIRIAAPAEVSGTVLFTSPEHGINPARQGSGIIIEKGATVNGLVYSGNLLNLGGTINGISVTGRFHFYRSPTDYYNWIRDGTVDRSRLSERFLIPLFLEPENRNFVPLVE